MAASLGICVVFVVYAVDSVRWSRHGTHPSIRSGYLWLPKSSGLSERSQTNADT